MFIERKFAFFVQNEMIGSVPANKKISNISWNFVYFFGPEYKYS